jgi:hypothetical protein
VVIVMLGVVADRGCDDRRDQCRSDAGSEGGNHDESRRFHCERRPGHSGWSLALPDQQRERHSQVAQ